MNNLTHKPEIHDHRIDFAIHIYIYIYIFINIIVNIYTIYISMMAKY